MFLVLLADGDNDAGVLHRLAVQKDGIHTAAKVFDRDAFDILRHSNRPDASLDNTAVLLPVLQFIRRNIGLGNIAAAACIRKTEVLIRMDVKPEDIVLHRFAVRARAADGDAGHGRSKVAENVFVGVCGIVGA